MRKSFVFLLCAVLLFSGCAKYEEHTIVSFDEESRIVIENSETDQISELLIKEKKYTFEGKDLVVLDVTNITGSSLSVTINVSFFTKNGKTVKTQTQTFDQFYSGYQNYFIFEPKIKFDHFTYTVSTVFKSGVAAMIASSIYVIVFYLGQLTLHMRYEPIVQVYLRYLSPLPRALRLHAAMADTGYYKSALSMHNDQPIHIVLGFCSLICFIGLGAGISYFRIRKRNV